MVPTTSSQMRRSHVASGAEGAKATFALCHSERIIASMSGAERSCGLGEETGVAGGAALAARETAGGAMPELQATRNPMAPTPPEMRIMATMLVVRDTAAQRYISDGA